MAVALAGGYVFVRPSVYTVIAPSCSHVLFDNGLVCPITISLLFDALGGRLVGKVVPDSFASLGI